MTTLFLVIAAGYLVGEINIKGFALGSGAVLFVGLACGALAPKAAPPGMLGTLGLLLFLYCVGIQYGGEWYRGLTSPAGLRANAAAICGLAASAAVALAINRTGAAGLPESLGMFAGATTSTPALQAVLDALGTRTPRSAAASRTRLASPDPSSACTSISRSSNRRLPLQRTG
jgi:putative transport protein